MEQNSIGKFISALRRANGMTQKELGERLFVSDKTVSRWERGECDPELSLIPAIAEIFGITTDELLRGARDSDRTETEDAEAAMRKTARSDRQFQRMIRARSVRFQNLSYLSVGLALVGLILAALFNLAFTLGFVGFCVGAIFVLASVICEICFAANAWMPYEDGEERHADTVAQLNTCVTRRTTAVLAFALAVFAFLLPIAIYTDPYTGLNAEFWLLYGVIFASAVLLVFYFQYVFFLRGLLIRRGMLTVSEERLALAHYEKQLLLRTTAVALSILLVLVIGMGVLEGFGAKVFARGEVFTSSADFIAYMEAHKRDGGPIYGNRFPWEDEVHASVVPDKIVGVGQNGEIVEGNGSDGIFVSPEGDVSVNPDDALHRDPSSGHPIVTVEDQDGTVLYEYVYNGDYVASIEWSFDTSEDGLPVTVYTREAMADAYGVYDMIQGALMAACALDLIVAAIVYIVKIKKKARAIA
ncbi:MAG: helix-turn-helix transcriptional regulator [Clostridia bacterium]|nr:helix-turn-helix transcriptional regulator [Clostridia bacterium]